MWNNSLNSLWNTYYSLLNNRYLNSFLYLFDLFDNILNNFLIDLLNLYNFILIYKFLLNNFNLFNCWYFNFYLNNFFNFLLNLFDLLNCLNNRDYFLDYSLDNLRNLLDMIDDLFSRFILDCIYYLLDNLLNLDNNWFLDHSFNNLFNYFFYFFNDLNDLFNYDCLLFDNLDFN